MGSLVHTGLGSSSLVAHVLPYPPPPHANSFVLGPVQVPGSSRVPTATPTHVLHYPPPRAQLDTLFTDGHRRKKKKTGNKPKRPKATSGAWRLSATNKRSSSLHHHPQTLSAPLEVFSQNCATKPHPTCASGNQSHPRVLLLHFRSSGGNLGDHLPLDRRAPDWFQRDGQPGPHRPRLVVSRSTCPPISPPPPRKQLCTRSCSNKHTHLADSASGPSGCPRNREIHS
jgi:hypothetical protein